MNTPELERLPDEQMYKMLSSCRRRRNIINTRGKKISVRCGTCPDCINAKMRSYEYLSNIECSNSQYCIFLTLHYDEYNVPVAKLVYSNEKSCYYLVDKTKRPLKTEGKFKKFKTYNKPIQSIYVSDENNFKEFLNRAKPLERNFDYYGPGYIRYCSFVDIQNFLKRIRFQIAQELDESPRYFAITEYGSDTFRPHIHILFFFNSPVLAEVFENFVSKTWKYGTFTCEHAFKRNRVSAYVTHYVNSAIDCPIYLLGKNIRPRQLHSQHFGQQYNKIIRDDFYKDISKAVEAHDITVDTFTLPYLKTLSIHNSIFPRCYNFSNLGYTGLYQLYTCYQRLSSRYNQTRSSQLTKLVLVFKDDPYNKTLLKRLELYDYLPSSEHLYTTYYETPLEELSDTELMFYNRVYSTIQLSKKFLSFNCENYSPSDVIRKIIDYYDKTELYLIKQQFRACITYHSLYDDDYSLFYYNITGYRDKYDNSPIIKSLNLKKDLKYIEESKHREQTTLNARFTEIFNL